MHKNLVKLFSLHSAITATVERFLFRQFELRTCIGEPPGGPPGGIEPWGG
jgi:hypothetical protein